jgi:hypothetical protein
MQAAKTAWGAGQIQPGGYPTIDTGSRFILRAAEIPQGLKPGVFVALSGTLERAAEKLVLAAESQPQALKRGRF